MISSLHVDLEKNLGVFGATIKASTLPPSPLTVHRNIEGFSQIDGILVTLWMNKSNEPVKINHVESLPFYIRPFLGRLKFIVNDEESIAEIPGSTVIFSPSAYRETSFQLDLEFSLAAGQTIRMELPFEKDFLRYTDFPFDPNRGFDLPGAMVKYRHGGHSHRIFTTKLLLTMPIPDFTMPYNTITITSTLIVLLYGTFFNTTFRRFYTGPRRLTRLKERLAASFARFRLPFRQG